MHRNQAVAVQIAADRYTIIGDYILITPRDSDTRRVKVQLFHEDGDIAMHCSLIAAHHGPIDTIKVKHGPNAPASTFSTAVDDYLAFWFGEPEAYPEI